MPSTSAESRQRRFGRMRDSVEADLEKGGRVARTRHPALGFSSVKRCTQRPARVTLPSHHQFLAKNSSEQRATSVCPNDAAV